MMAFDADLHSLRVGVFVIVRTPYRAWLENGDSDTP
jgi:hypothetical protein